MNPTPIWLTSHKEVWTYRRHQEWENTEERPREDTVRRHPSASQEDRPQKKSDLPKSWSWTSSPQKCEQQIHLCGLSHLVCSICYGGPNKLIPRVTKLKEWMMEGWVPERNTFVLSLSHLIFNHCSSKNLSYLPFSIMDRIKQIP